MVDSLSYFSFQPELHNWCKKGIGMCYPVCGLMHIKEPFLLIRKSCPCGGSRFPLSLSELSFTVYVRRHITINKICLSSSLNKTFPSLLPFFQTYGRKEGNVLFNDALNTFYLRLYGIGTYGKGPLR